MDDDPILERFRASQGYVPPPPLASVADDPVAARFYASQGRPEWSNPDIPAEQRVGDFLKVHAANVPIEGGPDEKRVFGRTYNYNAEQEQKSEADVLAKAKRLFPNIDEQQLKQHYQLQRAHVRQSKQGEDTLEFVAREMLPGASALGGFARTRRYGEAVKNFNDNKASPDDLEVIARYERLKGIETGESTGESTVRALAGVPAMVGEGYLGGAAVKGLGAVAPGLTRSGAAPAVARLGIQTTAMPSMYLKQGAENQLANPEESTFQSYAPAYGLGLAQTAVLGQLSGRFGNVPTVAGRLGARTGLGLAEQQGIDVAGTGLDRVTKEVTGKGLGLDTKWGTGAALWRGDDDSLKHAFVQTVTFAAFAGMHGQDPQAIFDGFKQAVNGRSLRSRDAVGKDLLDAVKPIQDHIAENKVPDADVLKKIVEDAPKESKPYVEAIVDSLPVDAWANENTVGSRDIPAELLGKGPETPKTAPPVAPTESRPSVQPGSGLGQGGPPLGHKLGPLPEAMTKAFPDAKIEYLGHDAMIIPHGDRLIHLAYDPKSNRAEVAFLFAKEGTKNENLVRNRDLSKGTLDLFHNFQKAAQGLKEAGVGVQFDTEPKRAGAFGRVLEKAGFVLRSATGEGLTKRFTYDPAPAKRSLKDALKNPRTEPLPSEGASVGALGLLKRKPVIEPVKPVAEESTQPDLTAAPYSLEHDLRGRAATSKTLTDKQKGVIDAMLSWRSIADIKTAGISKSPDRERDLAMAKLRKEDPKWAKYTTMEDALKDVGLENAKGRVNADLPKMDRTRKGQESATFVDDVAGGRSPRVSLGDAAAREAELAQAEVNEKYNAKAYRDLAKLLKKEIKNAEREDRPIDQKVLDQIAERRAAIATRATTTGAASRKPGKQLEPVPESVGKGQADVKLPAVEHGEMPKALQPPTRLRGDAAFAFGHAEGEKSSFVEDAAAKMLAEQMKTTVAHQGITAMKNKASAPTGPDSPTLWQRAKEGARTLWRNLQDGYAELGGTMFPATQRKSVETADGLARLISAKDYGRKLAPDLIDKVFPDRIIDHGDGTTSRVKASDDFMIRVGATAQEKFRFRHGREAMLGKFQELLDKAKTLKDPEAQRAMRNEAYEWQKKAAEVKTLIGQRIEKAGDLASVPLPDEETYQRYLKDPDVKEALRLYKKHVVPIIEANYKKAEGLDPDAEIESLTQTKGMPINARAWRPGDDTSRGVVSFGGGRDLTAPKQQKLGFARQAKLSAEGYVLHMGDIIENSIAKSTELAAKADVYRIAAKADVAKWGRGSSPGEGYQWRFKVEPPKGTQVAGEGEHFLWFNDHGTFKDFFKALDPTQQVPWKKFPLSGIFNKATLASLGEVTAHSKNLLTIMFRPGMGPVNLARNVRDVIRNTPEVRDRIIELARIGAMKPEGFEAQAGQLESKNPILKAAAKPLKWTGQLLDIIDKSMRLTADQAFSRNALRVGAKETEGNRRDFINQLGQYNRRAQNWTVQFLRDTGIGPFATAGSTYFINGLKALTLGHGMRGLDRNADLKMRGEILMRMTTMLAAIPVINYFAWGRVDGDDNTPLGGVKIGQSASGKTQYLDLANLTGMTRGARETGLLAYAEGTREGAKRMGATTADTVDAARRDIQHSVLHPFAGPVVSVGYTALTGNNTIGMRVAARPETDAQLKKLGKTPEQRTSETKANFTAAALHANPIIGALMQLADMDPGHTKPTTTQEEVFRQMGPFGVKARLNPPGAPHREMTIPMPTTEQRKEAPKKSLGTLRPVLR